MSEVRIISAADVKSLFTVSAALEAAENAFLQKQSGAGKVWPMLFHEFDPGKADLDIKSGGLGDDGIYGLKLVSWNESNPSRGLPELLSNTMLLDRETGQLRALLNATPISIYRTGAAAAVGAKYLARPDSESMVLVGCGTLAPMLIASLLVAMPQLKTVTVVNPHTPAKAAARLDAIVADVDALLAADGTERTAAITASEDTEAAVRAADVIVTATMAFEPVVKDVWVKPGAHLSCIGADLRGKQEVESKLLGRARVFGDDEVQCRSIGECEMPIKQRVISGIESEIGAVIAKKATGRISPMEITLFDYTGTALQDLAAALAIVKLAEQKGVGTVVEL